MNLDSLKEKAEELKEKSLRMKRKLLRQEDPDEAYDPYTSYAADGRTKEDFPEDVDYDSAGIEMAEDEVDEASQAKQLRKKQILIAGGAVIFLGAAAMAYNALSPDTPKEPKDQQKLSQNVSTNTLDGNNLPNSYSDIAKYQDKNQRGGAIKSQTPNGQPVHATYQTPQQTAARQNASTPSAARTTYQSAPRQTASSGSSSSSSRPSSGGGSSAPQARVSVTRETAVDKAWDEALKAEHEAMNSGIAFKIAQAVTQAVTGTQPASAATPNVTVTASRDDYGYGEEEPAGSEYALQAGSVIQATLLTGITSDSPNGDVVAQVRQNIYDSETGTHLLIPQGSRLIGTYGGAGSRGNKRIGVTFTRIILPDGASLELPNQNAIDGAGMLGLQDQYTQHSSTLFKTGIMTGLIAAAAQSATGSTSGTDTRSPGQEAVSGAVSQILDTADELIRRDASIAPTVTIRPGVEFSVFINQDILIRAYDG